MRIQGDDILVHHLFCVSSPTRLVLVKVCLLDFLTHIFLVAVVIGPLSFHPLPPPPLGEMDNKG
jgi:hypothetical protein